ncbi:hypothetical protein Pint_06468 [Pistacia integerrima]|uniref:Uncharacterized protein n=1 Tax=Pistacia integerrima TaxID=434235 RepID=A0ACC0Z837_9ROSI|nr:hypothetical protein Pint_06468 [Pistacia integerrima]
MVAVAMQSLCFSKCLVPSSHRLSPVPGPRISSLSFPRCSVPPRVRTIKCISLSSSPSLVNDTTRFAEASKNGNLVPLYRCIFSDQLTPVLAYRCLVKEDDREAPSFLFETVEPGSRGSTVGRYSVVGAQPVMEIVAKENKVTIVDHVEGNVVEEVVGDPMVIPRRISERWKPQLIDGLPDAFCGGWVGYFSYDTVRYVENKKLPFSKAPEDDRNLADIHLGLYDDVIVFDHVEKKAYVIHWVRLDQHSSVEKAYMEGVEHLEKISRQSTTHRPAKAVPRKAVLDAKEHIQAGDIFQIVLSQRFERRTFADPFEVYRALRIVNPSPYMTYLQARGCILVGSSPEILTRVKKVNRYSCQFHLLGFSEQSMRCSDAYFYMFIQNKIVNRPLAGTVRRGKSTVEDEMLKTLLLSNEKQCAEHIMLVDLGRNDVGKVFL